MRGCFWKCVRGGLTRRFEICFWVTLLLFYASQWKFSLFEGLFEIKHFRYHWGVILGEEPRQYFQNSGWNAAETQNIIVVFGALIPFFHISHLLYQVCITFFLAILLICHIVDTRLCAAAFAVVFVFRSSLVQQYDSFNINKCKSKEKNIQHEKTEHNKFYDYAIQNTECYIEIGPCLWARNVTLSQWTNFNAVHSMPCAFYFINKHVSACVWVCICIWIFKLCSSEWEQISLWKNLE